MDGVVARNFSSWCCVFTGMSVLSDNVMSDTPSVTLADTRMVICLNTLMASNMLDLSLGSRSSNNSSRVNLSLVEPLN